MMNSTKTPNTYISSTAANKKTLTKFICAAVLAFLLFLSFAFIFTFDTSGVASADSAKYIEISGNSTVFYTYSAKKELAAFTLPDSYFVKVLDDSAASEQTDPYYIVEYGGLTGYVNVSSLKNPPAANETVDSVGATPALTLNSKYTPVVFLRYNQTTLSITETTLSDAELLEMTYLGTSTINSTEYIFVRDNGSLNAGYGYIEKSSLADFSLPKHKVTLDRIATEQKNADDGKIEDGNKGGDAITSNKTLRIVLAVGIAVPSVLILILLFKPNKNNKRYSVDHARNQSYDRQPSRYDRVTKDTDSGRRSGFSKRHGKYEQEDDSRRYQNSGHRDKHSYDDYDRRAMRDYDDSRGVQIYDGRYDRNYDERGYGSRDYDQDYDRRGYDSRGYNNRDYDQGYESRDYGNKDYGRRGLNSGYSDHDDYRPIDDRDEYNGGYYDDRY